MLKLDEKFVKETYQKEARARRIKVTIKNEIMEKIVEKHNENPIPAQDTVAT